MLLAAINLFYVSRPSWLAVKVSSDTSGLIINTPAVSSQNIKTKAATASQKFNLIKTANIFRPIS